MILFDYFSVERKRLRKICVPLVIERNPVLCAMTIYVTRSLTHRSLESQGPLSPSTCL